MKKILDKDLLYKYYIKYEIERIFDKNIVNYVQLNFYEKGELILEAETELKYYYMLVDGKVKISYLFENGKSMFLKFYKDFVDIGDLEFLKNKPIKCNVEAIENTYLIAIPTAILRKHYMNNTNFLHHLVDSLSEKLEGTINNSSYNYVYPLINRLASYLLEHITNKNCIILDSSYKEISQFLGTTYRHLSRTFKELEAAAIIKCENRKIYILKREELKDLSKNSYIKSL
ncbi:helix-turn-helix domain-containing protein [Clostridium sp. BL-8]|uniref:Crp/Fnr family transcriptional regulator n=1 Tax=Clostridium sp. BL-8 TaxID=349938 RepID=UPI00098C7ADD|nr:helix-turn-helix domain-containing protein [Clostridium sp. BL-8]OOM81413.1 regulatory protein YeiL [Clostridium sp. BL-8]